MGHLDISPILVATAHFNSILAKRGKTLKVVLNWMQKILQECISGPLLPGLSSVEQNMGELGCYSSVYACWVNRVVSPQPTDTSVM